MLGLRQSQPLLEMTLLQRLLLLILLQMQKMLYTAVMRISQQQRRPGITALRQHQLRQQLTPPKSAEESSKRLNHNCRIQMQLLPEMRRWLQEMQSRAWRAACARSRQTWPAGTLLRMHRLHPRRASSPLQRLLAPPAGWQQQRGRPA